MLNVTCLRCGKNFEAKRSSGKFCSNACKMAYARNKSLLVFEDGRITLPADSPLSDALAEHPMCLIPEGKREGIPFGVIPPFDPVEKYALEIGHRMLDWCKNKPMSPEDVFVWLEANFNKKRKEVKADPINKDVEPTTVPVSKIVKGEKKVNDPLPGTNAYFIRHGKWE